MGDESLFRVDGLVAVITGAGSGLGRMMAQALASNGARKVYILGRRLEKLDQTAQDYDNIVPVKTDVTKKISLKAAADRVLSEVGFVNTLIVNSGASGPFALDMPRSGAIGSLQDYFWSYSPDEMNEAFAVNNTASFFTMVAFLELLHAGNQTPLQAGVQSSVIFTASIAGLARALATGVAYIPSKAGLIQSAKMYSTLLAGWHIRVNAIAPGMYPSELWSVFEKYYISTNVFRPGEMTETFIDNVKLLDTIPARRVGAEEDMRGLILFLTSRAGAYVNGDVLLSDGGRLGQMPASF